MWNVIFYVDETEILMQKPQNENHSHTHDAYELLGWCYANLVDICYGSFRWKINFMTLKWMAKFEMKNLSFLVSQALDSH